MTKLPAWIEAHLKTVSPRSDRRGLAQLFSEIFGVPYSHRTIEGRPYAWKIVNGRATTETRAAVEDEYGRYEAAVEYRTDGRTKADVDLK
jgi:hypothetical protein